MKKRETIKIYNIMKEEKNGTFFKMSERCNNLAIVKSKTTEKFVIVCGEYQVSPKEFYSIPDAEVYIEQCHFNEIFAMFYILNKYNDETKKQIDKSTENNK